MKLNLQLFADGGDGATGGTGAGVAQGTAAAEPGKAAQGRNALANVVYGKQEQTTQAAQTAQATTTGQTAQTAQPPADTKEAANSTPDIKAREKAFNDLIRGEYKDLYQQQVEGLINKRFKAHAQVESAYQQAQPIMDLMMQKYGVQDVAGLQSALEKDDALFEDEAMKRGMTVEQYRQLQKMEAENRQFRETLQRQQDEQAAMQMYRQWEQQAEKVKEHFPTFDLQAEADNPEFIKLLENNVDMKTAYIALHQDELLNNALTYTAKTVQKQTMDTVRAGANRPIENGTKAAPGVTIKTDVGKLTAMDRREIERRVARGERISF